MYQDQAYEYSLMQDAGYVNAWRDGHAVRTPVKGVTYVFDSQAGVEANSDVLKPYRFGLLFRDKEGKLQQLV
jgi:hypothetical protein